MATTLAIANQKGGVGKTTTTLHLGHEWARRGRRVLMVDADPQASLSRYCGMDPDALNDQDMTLSAVMAEDQTLEAVVIGEQPALLPCSVHLAMLEGLLHGHPDGALFLRDRLQAAQDDYDDILIDCSPSLGILTLNALAAADHVLVPTKTDYLSLTGLSLILESVQNVRQRLQPGLAVIGVLPTMYDIRNRHDREAYQELVQLMRGVCPVFEPIRRSTLFDQASAEAVPLSDIAPGHAGVQSYRLFAEQLANEIHIRGA